MEKSTSKAPGKLGNGMNKEKSRLPEKKKTVINSEEWFWWGISQEQDPGLLSIREQLCGAKTKSGYFMGLAATWQKGVE